MDVIKKINFIPDARPTMKRSITAKKSGMSPGTLIHTGEKKVEQTRISFFDYDPIALSENPSAGMEDVIPLKESSTTSWINVSGVHDEKVIDFIGTHFGIHSLTLEDIMNTSQRPKVEEFDEYVYVVIKMLDFEGSSEHIHSEQVSFVLGKNFLISFQENHGDVFNSVRERIRKAKGRIRSKKADYLLYALMDAIVDNYYLILETIGDRIEMLEEEVLTKFSQDALTSLHTLKRELIYFRRQAWHVRDFLNILEKGETSFFESGTALFLRDLYDHTIQVIDAVESLRDILTGVEDLFVSGLSNRMNEVMKMLTIIATIFIPITFIAGVYGMNFKYMPELSKRWGYPMFWIIVIVSVAGMLGYFRKKKWL